MSQLAYFSPLFRIAFFLLLFSFIAVFTFGSRISLIDTVSERMKRLLSKTPKSLMIIVAGIGLCALFYIFRDSTSLLGDGMLRIGELGRGKPIPATEPLQFLAQSLSLLYILKPLGLTHYDVYPSWSYIAGLLFLLGVWLFARDLNGEGIESPFTFAYLSGWGGLMLFFGYVENYSLTAAVLLLLFVAANRYILRGDNLVVLVGTFLLGVFLHNLLVFFLPAVAYILMASYRQRRTATMLGLIVLFGPAITWMVLSYGGAEIGAFLLPGSPSEPGYLLWSQAHLMDILNELFLVSPAFLIVVWLVRVDRQGPNMRRRIFFWLAALSGLGILLFLDPKLGMARDWDLFALLLMPFHIALFVSVDWKKVGRFLKSAIACISIFFTLLWVVLDSSEAHSLLRYNDIVKLDYERGRYGYERLGVFHMLRGRWQESEEAYNSCLQRQPHAKSYIGLGVVQMRQGKNEQALQSLETALRIEPRGVLAYRYLGELYFRLGRCDDAKRHLTRFLRASHDRPDHGGEHLLLEIEECLETQEGS